MNKISTYTNTNSQAMSILNQMFRILISENLPSEIEEEINNFLPTKEQVRKKKRMHQDLWFFKDHSSKSDHTSFWRYREPECDTTDGPLWNVNGEVRILDCDDCVVYCDGYNLRNSHSMFCSGFLTFKDQLFIEDSGWSRGVYEKLLFDSDGEVTDNLRMLNSTSEFIDVAFTNETSEPVSNRGRFLGGGNGGDPYYTENPIGITILNIISKAMDGIYNYEWSSDGFGGDDTGDYDTGDYAEDVLTIYNSPGEYHHDNHLKPFPIKDYINGMYEKWTDDPDGRYTGLIIGNRDEDDLDQLMEKTDEGEMFFSIFEKPNCDHIVGGYWGYQRDGLVDGKIVDGPTAAFRAWNTFRSQNEIDAALERGIVLDRRIV